ncbi:hypothetical protein SALBM311S_01648 [Streptomyces alboniger]
MPDSMTPSAKNLTVRAVSSPGAALSTSSRSAAKRAIRSRQPSGSRVEGEIRADGQTRLGGRGGDPDVGMVRLDPGVLDQGHGGGEPGSGLPQRGHLRLVGRRGDQGECRG